MPSIINALTAAGGGIAISGDSTGNLTIQSAGTNVATFTTGSNLQLNQSGGKILNSSGNPIVQSTGSVLQVISATDSTERNTTSTSFGTASNTLSVTITPTASTSKIFIICNTGVFKATAGSGYVTIYRNSTNLGSGGGMAQFQQAVYSSTSISFLDSPATTSATTYQLYFRSNDSNPAYIGANNGGGGTGSLTVFEIAG